jgi:Protein of unknown function (DUF3592)
LVVGSSPTALNSFCLKNTMVALYIVTGWLVAGALAAIVFYHQKSLKMTSATTASVISATNREIRNAHGRHDETVVVAEFTAAGQTYRVTHIFPGKNADRFPSGSKLPVRYNPGDPNMSMVPRA